MGVDDTARNWRRAASRLVARTQRMKPLAFTGVAAVTAGIWHGYGMTFGLITLGGLLILDALT